MSRIRITEGDLFIQDGAGASPASQQGGGGGVVRAKTTLINEC